MYVKLTFRKRLPILTRPTDGCARTTCLGSKGSVPEGSGLSSGEGRPATDDDSTSTRRENRFY